MPGSPILGDRAMAVTLSTAMSASQQHEESDLHSGRGQFCSRTPVGWGVGVE